MPCSRQGVSPPDTPDVSAHQGIVHHRKAAVAADDDILCRAIQDTAEQLFHLRQAVNATVAPTIDTLGALIVGAVGQCQHGVGQIELFWRGSAAGHIELLASSLEAGDAGIEFGFALHELGGLKESSIKVLSGRKTRSVRRTCSQGEIGPERQETWGPDSSS